MSAAKATLEQRIDQQESWTFHECLGLASEYNVKVRVVIVTVYARGKQYIDGDAPGSQTRPP